MALPGAKANTSGAGSLRSESEETQHRQVLEGWSIAVGAPSSARERLRANAKPFIDEAFARMGE